jgi:hypothetical protein
VGYVTRPSAALKKRQQKPDLGVRLPTKAGDEIPLGDDSLRGHFLVVRKAVTTGSLPPDLSGPTATNLEELAACLLVS